MSSLDAPNPRAAGIVMGLTIVGVGILLLLDQTGVLGWHPRWSIWPFLLIAAGLARWVSPRRDGSRDGGWPIWWPIFIGVWLLLNQMRVLRFDTSWPLILVALGIHTIWKALRPHRAARSQAGHS